MLTEKDIMEARNSRYGRRRSQSIDYGSQGRGKSGFEQTPEQALYSHSCQILKTIPRFQYEAPSWVPNLLKVQDTQEERNAEVVHLFLCYFQEVFEYQYDTIPFEVNGKQYSEYRTFRVAVLGDVGIFHSFPIDFRRRKDFFVTNLPAEERKSFPPSHEWVFFCY